MRACFLTSRPETCCLRCACAQRGCCSPQRKRVRSVRRLHSSETKHVGRESLGQGWGFAELTMRIDIQHRFQGAQLKRVEQLYLLDESFNSAAFERIGYSRRLQSLELDGDSLKRSLCLSPHRPLPPPFGSFAPGGLFQIGEHISYDLQSHRGSWRTVPSVLANQFEA